MHQNFQQKQHLEANKKRRKKNNDSIYNNNNNSKQAKLLEMTSAQRETPINKPKAATHAIDKV
jgi:hypothetical protein